jgi:hypothetical protein
VSPKSAVIAAAALAVVAFAVYLFFEVRATPTHAGATVSHQTPPPTRQAAPASVPAEAPTTSSPTTASASPSPGAQARVNKEPMLGREVNGPPPPVAPPDDQAINVKLDNLMELANKSYDQQDFDQAVAIAGKVLAKDPNNVRMLRIMVSANCIQGDSVVAQQHYERLPKPDRDQMRTRCDRYGVSFKEPSP